MSKFLKLIIIGLTPFIIFALLVEFVFSYLNQSPNGPHLNLLNFVCPFFLTIFFILLTFFILLIGHRLIFNRDFFNSLKFSLRLLIIVLILSVIVWQSWYLLTSYKIHDSISVFEFLPMCFGVGCSIFLIILLLQKRVPTSDKQVI